MHLILNLTLNGLHKFISNPRQRTFMKLALLYGGKKRYKKGKIKFDGFNFIVADYMSFLFQYKEIFVDEYYMFQSDNDSPVIYDCGSNVGTSCAYFKMIFPNSTIKAFEAEQGIADLLKTNIKNNGLTKTEVVEKAVWIDNNGVNLSVEGADGSSVYLGENVKRVNSVRLKEMLDSESKVDMLKMDIEGAENDVILDCGDSLKVVDNIFIEYHSYTNSKQKLSELLNVLEQNKFRYFIKNDSDRNMPLINKTKADNLPIDLQLNIFGYKN
jgi:FkbM family methyltransferase